MTSWVAALRHWPEYLMEAAGLGVFMLSACTFGTLLGHGGSPVVGAVPETSARRAMMGLAMGLTAALLIYSPWGKRSGAHLNPSVTLTFLRLGKVQPVDAVFYVIAQLAGGVLGVWLATLIFGTWLADPGVRWVVTVPGRFGIAAAFLAELAISFVLMLVLLRVSQVPGLNRYTGLVAGALVATWILVEAPVSGMSMNPARTLGSALWSHTWTAFWVYVLAPVAGMLLASEVYRRLDGARILCAKLHHENTERCIFRCGWTGTPAAAAPGRSSWKRTTATT